MECIWLPDNSSVSSFERPLSELPENTMHTNYHQQLT